MNIQSHPSTDTATVEPKTAASGIASTDINNPEPSHSDTLAKKPGSGGKRPAKAPGKPVTKHDRLIRLLSRAKGADIDQLVKELDWQAHTIRAAISRLRKAGQGIETGKSKQGKTTYRIVSGDGQAGSGK